MDGNLEPYWLFAGDGRLSLRVLLERAVAVAAVAAAAAFASAATALANFWGDTAPLCCDGGFTAADGTSSGNSFMKRGVNLSKILFSFCWSIALMISVSKYYIRRSACARSQAPPAVKVLVALGLSSGG